MPAAGLPTGEGFGEKFRTYVVLETSWWVAVYAICYQFKPTVLIMQTGWGNAAVRRAGAWLKQSWPSRYDGIAKAADRVYTSPNGRTFGEWMLINKILAPVSFPAKFALANRIVNQRAALASVGAVSAVVAADVSTCGEPDLVPEAVPDVVRTLSRKAIEKTSTAVGAPQQ